MKRRREEDGRRMKAIVFIGGDKGEGASRSVGGVGSMSELKGKEPSRRKRVLVKVSPPKPNCWSKVPTHQSKQKRRLPANNTAPDESQKAKAMQQSIRIYRRANCYIHMVCLRDTDTAPRGGTKPSLWDTSFCASTPLCPIMRCHAVPCRQEQLLLSNMKSKLLSASRFTPQRIATARNCFQSKEQGLALPSAARFRSRCMFPRGDGRAFAATSTRQRPGYLPFPICRVHMTDLIVSRDQ